MNRKITLLVAAAAALVAAAAFAALGGTGSASAQPAPKGALVTLGQTALGKVLVDARGRTLYLFEKDKHGKSACYSACAKYWPPLFSSAKPRVGKGVRLSLLGMTKRNDGKRQVTYAGHPLYTFISDTRAGQTIGEGVKSFGAAWDVLAASGDAVERTTSDSSGSDDSGGYTGGYSY
jgi:predicted lipoprotein with Yx(FWY)xxD motif